MHELDSLFFAAELGGAPEIDLHGWSRENAIKELELFLHAEWYRKARVIKVIHGRGAGTLRNTLHAWLNKETQLVLAFRDSTRMDEVGAVTYVALASK